MSHLYRLRLADGATWAIVAADLAEAQSKANVYFPNEHVTIEESHDGGPWRLADAGCSKCPAGDVMPDLGHACATSCGADRYPTEVE